MRLKEAPKYKDLIKLNNTTWKYKDKVTIGYNEYGKYYFVSEPSELDWMYSSESLKDLLNSIDNELKDEMDESIEALDKYNLNKMGRIEFYEKENGDCPVFDFIESIKDEKLKLKTLDNIKELDDLGNTARPPLSVHVGEGIYELRTKQGSNIDRIFYFFVFGNKIIMTNGYIKKSQQLDKLEFNKARKYRNDYLDRVEGGNK